MMNDINSVANEARSINDENPADRYLKMKKYEYRYLEVLKSYIPQLLNNEKFFTSVFK